MMRNLSLPLRSNTDLLNCAEKVPPDLNMIVCSTHYLGIADFSAVQYSGETAHISCANQLVILVSLWRYNCLMTRADEKYAGNRLGGGHIIGSLFTLNLCYMDSVLSFLHIGIICIALSYWPTG